MDMEGGQAIYVVFITDDGFVMPTSVAITSMILNKREETVYNISILTDGISKDSESKLKSLEGPGVRIDLVKMDRGELLGMGRSSIPDSIHVSITSMFKFLIPDLFKGLDKILYLDGDVLVRRDLTELYNTDISDTYAAVVSDMKPVVGYLIPHMRKLGIDNESYFNSGMMLLNLERMRNDNLSEMLFEYRKSGLNLFMDQDALNYVLGVNVRYVDVKFNFTYSSYNYFLFKHFKEYHNIDESDYQKVLDSIVVLHLNGKDKPWLCNDISFSDEWDYYFEGSPFKDMVLNRRSESNPTLETIKVTFSYLFRRLTHRTPRWFVDLYLKLGDKFNLILR